MKILGSIDNRTRIDDSIIVVILITIRIHEIFVVFIIIPPISNIGDIGP